MIGASALKNYKLLSIKNNTLNNRLDDPFSLTTKNKNRKIATAVQKSKIITKIKSVVRKFCEVFNVNRCLKSKIIQYDAKKQ